MKELEAAFVARTIHPKDLKLNVTAALNALLEPIRVKFQDPRLVGSHDRPLCDMDSSH